MDYPVEASRAFQSLASEDRPFKFVYVSGRGATFQPGPFTPAFGRIKGETELILSAMRKEHPNFHASTVRPGFVEHTAHGAIKPYAPPQGILKSALFTALVPIMKTAARSNWSPTLPLGEFLTKMAMGKWDDQLQGEGVEMLGDFPVMENTAIRRLNGFDTKEK